MLKQIGHVILLQLKRDRFRGPTLLILILTCIPVFTLSLRSVIILYNPLDLFPHIASNDQLRSPLSELKVFSVFFHNYFQFCYIVIALYAGAHLFKDEFSRRTMHHLLLCSIERKFLLIGKYSAYCFLCIPLCLIAVSISYFLFLIPTGFSHSLDFIVHQKGLIYLFQYLLITILALGAYGAISIFFGLSFSNPNIPGFVLLLWEMVIAYIPGILKPISIAYYLQSMLPVDIPKYRIFEIIAKPASQFVSVSVLLIVSALFLAGASAILSRKEILYT